MARLPNSAEIPRAMPGLHAGLDISLLTGAISLLSIAGNQSPWPQVVAGIPTLVLFGVQKSRVFPVLSLQTRESIPEASSPQTPPAAVGRASRRQSDRGCLVA